jgi:hypothetical protein
MFLQSLAGANSPNSEQQDLHFVKHTLTQWIKRWEQQLNLKLFGSRKRERFVEFNVDGLLRGDFRTRMEGYARAIQNAIYTPDEVRGMENWWRRRQAAYSGRHGTVRRAAAARRRSAGALTGRAHQNAASLYGVRRRFPWLSAARIARSSCAGLARASGMEPPDARGHRGVAGWPNRSEG